MKVNIRSVKWLDLLRHMIPTQKTVRNHLILGTPQYNFCSEFCFWGRGAKPLKISKSNIAPKPKFYSRRGGVTQD